MNKHLVSNEAITKIQADCLVIGIFENEQSKILQEIDKATKGIINRVIKKQEFIGTVGSSYNIFEAKGIASTSLLLIGLGKSKFEESEKDNLKLEKNFKKACNALGKLLKTKKSSKIALCLPDCFGEIIVGKTNWALTQAIVNIERAMYVYPALKQKKSKPQSPKTFYWINSTKNKNYQSALKNGVGIYWAMEKMLLVANHPANICTPDNFAKFAKTWVDELKKAKAPISINILDKKQIAGQKMNCFLSVAQGSDNEPRLVEIKYLGRKKSPITALVGKGVTFDSGGISLKPGSQMDHMKWDMCGAASVLATILASAKIGLPINLVAIMPLTENLPSGKAVKPSDVVKTMSGLTVENLNTDAEGRLILCDALTYVQKYHNPKTIIDVATLTGACVVALGSLRLGLISNQQELADKLLAAGDDALDFGWQLPFDQDYLEGMKSNFADIANISGRGAGTITAAMFLSKFIEKNVNWGHLDIAGVAYNESGPEKGATGRPLMMLMQYLFNNC